MAKHGGIKDKGEYFVISPTSRKVTVPNAHKAIGTVGDHNSEQITFECPQIIDGHDVSQCSDRYITWINALGEGGHDELHEAQVEQGADGMIYLSWTIRNGLTVTKGIVQFSIHFEDVDEDGTTLYRWSTATCQDCNILDSINAVLGEYEAIYVNGETLVIADYTPVVNDTLSLETDGIIPSGAVELKENGTHDVGMYGEAIVNVDTAPFNADFKILNDSSHRIQVLCKYFENGEFIRSQGAVECGETGVFRIAVGSTFYAHSEILRPITMTSNKLQHRLYDENGTLLGKLTLLPSADMHTVIVYDKIDVS